MSSKPLEIDVPEELYEELRRIGDALGISQPAEAALIAIGDWVSRRKAELDDRDPAQRYFVNEALDELLARKK